MNVQRGDDLEDDFVPDDLVASSGEEDITFDSRQGAAGDIDGLLSADEEAEQDEPPPKGKAVLAKRKRREKDKERQAKKRKLAETVEVVEPPSVAAQPAQKLAHYMSTMQAKSFPEPTRLELDDICIPETAITDTTQWTESRSLDRLVDFIITVLPVLHKRLSQSSKSQGAPTLLYIAGAALRVADVTRVLKDKRLRGDKGGDVAKLFAKHFKLQEHVAYLKRSKIGSAAGTPGRVGKLLCETDALSMSQLTHIILDISFRDAKKRNLLDIPETRNEIFKTVLGAPKVLEGIRQGKIHVVLF
ncbi:U3-containing 90S pre-ribosomal complex subunit-domain containing protein [Boletus reticuloceps]|uniref:U3-containing 90S pre-ribosomal complex subunit-domain containing protein n=1 Tax=Boletus reticuloceps TaxID=495285 RepID=A0A8I3AAX0_9AGAM|nr:U3-containing 90S pre-ribosomal complex subunit-domain containing protein [Boletus reticuloceps]